MAAIFEVISDLATDWTFYDHQFLERESLNRRTSEAGIEVKIGKLE